MARQKLAKVRRDCLTGKMMRDAIKQFFTYGAGSIAQKALSFILLPLFLHFFEPEEYGVISLLLVVILLLSTLTDVGIVSGLHRLYFEAEDKEKKNFLGTTWLFHLFGATLGGVILLFGSSFLSQILFRTIAYSYPIKLLGLFFFLFLIQNIPFEILRLEKRAGSYVGFSLFQFVLDFGLKLYFIAFLKRGINGYFESSVITHIITLCFISPFILKYVSFSFNASYLKQLLRLGFPFIFSGIAIWTLNMSDKLILNYFSGAAAVGIYSLADRFANLFNIFLFNPSAIFWSPFFFSYAAKRSSEKTKKVLNRALVYFFIAGCILYLAISLGSGDVLRIFTTLFAAKKEYWQAINLVPLLTLGPFLYLLSRQAGNALLLAKRPEFTATAFCIAAAVNIGLNFIFIPKFGALGAAITTVIAYILYEVLIYWWAQRIWPVSHDWKGLCKGLLFLAVAFIIGWNIKINQPWTSLFVKVIVGVGVFGLFAWFISNILTSTEQHKFSAYLVERGRKIANKLRYRS